MEHVVKDVNLIGEQLFDHTPIINKESQRIFDNFERNERFREFDGLIRASHALVEATDVSPGPLPPEEFKQLNEEINNLKRKILRLSAPINKKEHDEYLEKISKEHNEQVLAVETEVLRQKLKIREEFMRGRGGAHQPSFDASIVSEVDLS